MRVTCEVPGEGRGESRCRSPIGGSCASSDRGLRALSGQHECARHRVPHSRVVGLRHSVVTGGGDGAGDFHDARGARDVRMAASVVAERIDQRIADACVLRAEDVGRERVAEVKCAIALRRRIRSARFRRCAHRASPRPRRRCRPADRSDHGCRHLETSASSMPSEFEINATFTPLARISSIDDTEALRYDLHQRFSFTWSSHAAVEQLRDLLAREARRGARWCRPCDPIPPRRASL